MTDEPYSKRELDIHFTEIKRDLKEIKVQTTKHNGRLTNVERWMYGMAGGLTVLAFLVGAKLLTFI